MELGMYVRVGRIVLRFLMTVPALLMGFGLYSMLLIFSAVQVLGFFFSLYIFAHNISPLKYRIDLGLIKDFAKRGFPFLLSSAFVEAYFRIDIALLSKLAPASLAGFYSSISADTVIGWYSAAYNILDTIISVPGAVSTALLPVMVIYFATKKDKLPWIYQNTIKYLTMLSVPAAIGLSILAYKTIMLLYGPEYANSSLALSILVWTLVPLFINYAMGAMLIAVHKEYYGVGILFMNTLVNVSLNWYLIPRYSYLGAAWATVLTEVFYFTCYYFLLKWLGYSFSLGIFIKPILAGVVMALVLIQTLEWHLLIQVGLGMAVYFLFLFAIKGVGLEDLKFLSKIK
jgi:O-antigen/teichoic acid export membrane protein